MAVEVGLVDGAEGLTRLALAREAIGMAHAACVYPLGFRRPDLQAVHRLQAAALGPAALRICSTPVVLVPGYMGNRSNWFALERSLHAAGFVDVYTVSYVPVATTVEALAEHVLHACLYALERSGADQLHVVGHSLGGVLLRYTAHRLGLAPRLATAVTIATPHRGASVARLGRGAVAAALRPSSSLYDSLEHACRADGIRWVAYYSNADIVVPPRSARLEHPALTVENVLVPDHGHLSILRAPAVLQSVPELLLEGELESAQARALPLHAHRAQPVAA